MAEQAGIRALPQMSEALRLHARVSPGTEPVQVLLTDAERLRRELTAVGDQLGAERASETAKFRFFSGHAADALELAQELLATDLPGRCTATRCWGGVPRSLFGVRCLYPKRSSLSMSWRPRSERRSGREPHPEGARGALAEQGRFEDARAELEIAKRNAEDLGAGYVISALRVTSWVLSSSSRAMLPRAVELELIAYSG